MVFRAADLPRQGDQSFEVEMIPRSRWRAKTLPGSTPVIADVSVADVFFERGERGAHHILECRPIQRIQLLLRIVQIVDIECAESEVFPAARDLVTEIARCKAVSAADDVGGRHYPRPVVLTLQKSPI